MLDGVYALSVFLRALRAFVSADTFSFGFLIIRTLVLQFRISRSVVVCFARLLGPRTQVSLAALLAISPSTRAERLRTGEPSAIP